MLWFAAVTNPDRQQQQQQQLKMATSVKKPAKGILKKPSSTGSETSSSKVDESQARNTAIQHARIIHHRRELEDQITNSIIEMVKLPLLQSPPYSAANPSPEDAETFRRGVRLFQPSDYDDLIEERNTNGLCGYTLCPKPRVRVLQAGEYKLVNYGKKDFNIVPKKEIERWCSQKCARRAMYVKVQLNETAAWERAGIESIQIDLYEEPNKSDDDPASRLAKEMEDLKVEAGRKAAQDARDLALERGDAAGERKSQRSVPVRIRDKLVTQEVKEPSLDKQDDQGHMVLDGYKTKFESRAKDYIDAADD